VWPALRLSLFTTLTSLAVVVTFGTPLAFTLARASGRLVKLVEAAVQLPIVVPPAVAGVALLLAFGRRGLVTSVFRGADRSLAFTTAAVVVAEVFVSAPFFVQAAISAFRRVDPQLELVARTFGASPLRVFFRVALPLASPGLVAGAAMSWARSLGEFGATLMFAGNLEGRTQTLPLAIYTALESDLRAAQALSMVLVVVAFALLAFVRVAVRRTDADAPEVGR
jgi:molybdate transport system permease protein